MKSNEHDTPSPDRFLPPPRFVWPDGPSLRRHAVLRRGRRNHRAVRGPGARPPPHADVAMRIRPAHRRAAPARLAGASGSARDFFRPRLHRRTTSAHGRGHRRGGPRNRAARLSARKARVSERGRGGSHSGAEHRHSDAADRHTTGGLPRALVRDQSLDAGTAAQARPELLRQRNGR